MGTLISIFIVIAGLKLADDILIPFALAILLSFVLAPLVTRIEAFRLKRVPAVILVTLITTGVIAAAGWTIIGQGSGLLETAPLYTSHIKAKIRAGKKFISELRRNVAAETIAEAISQDIPRAESAGELPNTPITLLREMLGTLFGALATLGIVVIISIFVLIYREDLRDRLICTSYDLI